MSSINWLRLLAAVALSFGLMGCDRGGDETAPDGESAAEATAPVEGDASGVTDDPDAPPIGQISSGTAEVPEPVEEPARPDTGARNRPATLAEAMEAVDFTVLEPKQWPVDVHRDMIHVVEPDAGGSEAGLPAVRFIYTVDEGGTVVLLQSPATGEAAEGTEVAISGHTAWMRKADEYSILTWEQDNVRLELRGSTVDEPTLIAIAESVGPADAAGDG